MLSLFLGNSQWYINWFPNDGSQCSTQKFTKRITIVVDMVCPLGAGLSGKNTESMVVDHNGQRVSECPLHAKTPFYRFRRRVGTFKLLQRTLLIVNIFPVVVKSRCSIPPLVSVFCQVFSSWTCMKIKYLSLGVVKQQTIDQSIKRYIKTISNLVKNIIYLITED